MSDWPWEADKTNLLNRKARWEDDRYPYDWHFVDHADMVDWMNSPIDVTLNAWKCKMLDKVKSHLSLLDREVELSKMTAQFDQLGTEVPLALCICNEVVKDELQQVTAKLSELGSALGPDPGPFRVPGPLATAHEESIFDIICMMFMAIGGGLLPTLALFIPHGIPYIATSISDFISMMYVYNMTVPTVPVDNADMNVEVLADLSDVSVWTLISELNHCSMVVAYNTIMSVFE